MTTVQPGSAPRGTSAPTVDGTAAGPTSYPHLSRPAMRDSVHEHLAALVLCDVKRVTITKDALIRVIAENRDPADALAAVVAMFTGKE